MSQTIFIPVTCNACRRTSALGLPAEEVQHRLEQGVEIALRCGFDGETWNASPRERARLERLCRENNMLPPRRQSAPAVLWSRE